MDTNQEAEEEEEAGIAGAAIGNTNTSSTFSTPIVQLAITTTTREENDLYFKGVVPKPQPELAPSRQQYHHHTAGTSAGASSRFGSPFGWVKVDKNLNKGTGQKVFLWYRRRRPHATFLEPALTEVVVASHSDMHKAKDFKQTGLVTLSSVTAGGVRGQQFEVLSGSLSATTTTLGLNFWNSGSGMHICMRFEEPQLAFVPSSPPV
jgi:hypothetical protein